MDINEFVESIQEIIILLEERNIDVLPLLASIKTGKGTRFLINKEPKHRSGVAMFHPKEIKGKDGILFLECSWSNVRKEELIISLAEKYDIDLSMLVGFEEEEEESMDVEEYLQVPKGMIIDRKSGDMSISQMKELYIAGRLCLSPEFQRRVVWDESDASYLIDTIVRDFPIPRIYLNVRLKDGIEYFDVIDGRQRLLSILAYIGLVGDNAKKEDVVTYNGYSAKTKHGELDKDIDGKRYSELEDSVKDKILSYVIYSERIKNAESQVMKNLYYRLNKTVKALTPQEIRFGKSDGAFRILVEELRDENNAYFEENRIISAKGFNRMSDSKLIALLLGITTHEGLSRFPDNVFLDSLYERLGTVDLKREAKIFRKTIGIIKQLSNFDFDIRRSIFKGTTNFLCLYTTIFELLNANFKFSKASMKEIANFLIRFNLEYRKRIEDIRIDGVRNYRERSITGTSGSDKRKKKIEYLVEHIEPLLIPVDKIRSFSNAQKEFVWHSSERKCANKSCGKVFSNMSECEFDHIKPWSKGGMTSIDNCQILCKKHHVEKGTTEYDYRKEKKDLLIVTKEELDEAFGTEGIEE